MTINHDKLSYADMLVDQPDTIIAMDWKDASEMNLVQMKGRMVRKVLDVAADFHRLTDDLYDAREWELGPWD